MTRFSQLHSKRQKNNINMSLYFYLSQNISAHYRKTLRYEMSYHNASLGNTVQIHSFPPGPYLLHSWVMVEDKDLARRLGRKIKWRKIKRWISWTCQSSLACCYYQGKAGFLVPRGFFYFSLPRVPMASMDSAIVCWSSPAHPVKSPDKRVQVNSTIGLLKHLSLFGPFIGTLRYC